MKLSILTTCYNQRYEIERLLDSILKQQLPFEYEILIGDDGSTDNSVEYLKEVESKYPNIIKVYYNNPSKEKFFTIHSKASRASDNRYRLFKEMFKHKSEYFTIIDGDDYYTNEKCLEDAVMFMDNNKNIQGVCYNFDVFYTENSQREIRKLKKATYSRKSNYINKKYYLISTWHHVSSYVFRTDNLEQSIDKLGINKLIDDGIITSKIFDSSNKIDKNRNEQNMEIYYNKEKSIFIYVISDNGIYSGSEQIEKYMLTMGSYAIKLFENGAGKIIALKAAENYKTLNKNINSINQLKNEIISYYQKLYKSYDDKILMEILEHNKSSFDKAKLNIKISFLYAKYKVIKYIYKQYYKLKNL